MALTQAQFADAIREISDDNREPVLATSAGDDGHGAADPATSSETGDTWTTPRADPWSSERDPAELAGDGAANTADKPVQEPPVEPAEDEGVPETVDESTNNESGEPSGETPENPEPE